MAEAPMIKVVDHCRVKSRSSFSSSPILLNLSPFDIPWCFIMGDAANQIKRIYLYEFPNSDSIHQQVVPSLKTSLSLALENFYPYASKLVFPPFSEKPRFLYTDGDSVPFTVAESMMDFGELVGDRIKDAKLFHPLIPKLSPKIKSPEDDGTWIVPDLLAIQITIFPDSGLCIGIHYNHTVGDGTSISNFLKLWASICQTGSVETWMVPFLNRDVTEDAIGVQSIQVWKEWSQAFPTHNKSPALPPSKALRATFILSKTNIKRLKEWILNHQQQQPTLVSNNISSFAAACAFAWICYVKSTQHGESDDVMSSLGGGESGDNIVQLYEFNFAADVRNRLKSPIPEIYLGNCLVSCHVRIDKKVLLGQHGIVYAAKAISEKVKELTDDGGAERVYETSLSNIKALPIGRLSVAGSPRQAVYGTDFGWGRPKKCEVVNIDAGSVISLAETKDEEGGGLEIGVALESVAMDKFTTLFQSFI